MKKIITPAVFAKNANDGRYYIPPHIRYIDKVLMDAVMGKLSQQIIILEAPPRHGKSELISKHFPAWYLGRFPDRHVILTSYGASLARGWGRKARKLLDDHGDWFGVQLNENVRAGFEWETEFGGGMVSAGVGGSVTGHGANLFIIDDYLKNSRDAMSERVRESQWDWFDSTALTRLEPDSLMVIMATRWHVDDLIGRIRKREQEDPDFPDVLHISMPALAKDGENDPLGRKPGEALWPKRWTRNRLLRRKASMSAFWWNSMYQQSPSLHEDVEWPPEYFGSHIWCPKSEFPKNFEVFGISIDPSKGKNPKRGDYAAIIGGGVKGKKLYVTGRVQRLPAEDIIDSVFTLRKRFPLLDAVSLESNAWQDLLEPIANYRAKEQRLSELPIVTVYNSVKKELRIARIGPYLQKKQLVFEDTPDMRRLVQQLSEFPLADYDDGPDALEMLLRLIVWLTSEEVETMELGDSMEEVVLL